MPLLPFKQEKMVINDFFQLQFVLSSFNSIVGTVTVLFIKISHR